MLDFRNLAWKEYSMVTNLLDWWNPLRLSGGFESNLDAVVGDKLVALKRRKTCYIFITICVVSRKQKLFLLFLPLRINSQSLGKPLPEKSGILWKSFIKRWPLPPVLLLWNPYSELWPYFWVTILFLNKRYEIRLTPPPVCDFFSHKIPLFGFP